MFQPISIFIGLRYSRSQRHLGFVSFITFFSIAGILLGVSALITVVSVMNGFEGELKKRILGLVPHVVISSPLLMQETVTQEKKSKPAWLTVDKLSVLAKKNPHVLGATPYVEAEALIQSNKEMAGVLLQGVFPDKEQSLLLIANSMINGAMSDLQAGKYRIIIGAVLARKMGVRVGDKIRVLLPTKMIYSPMGRVPVQRIFTLAGVFHVGSQVDNQMVLIHGTDATRLLRRKGSGIDKLRLYLDDAFSAQSVVNELEQHSEFSNLELTTWSTSQGTLFQAVKMEKNMMWLMLSLVVAVAAFNVVSALVMVVIEKQGEIGILKTLGLDSTGIVKVFVTQGMINGLWGVSLGAIMGSVLTLNINSIMSFLGVSLLGNGYQSQALPTELRLEQVAIIVLSALLMSFVATLYPAYRASKTQPAEVLRNE